MSEPAYEVNFDGLVGPTHNYAGLSYGNLASQKWKGTPSNPKAAALEGLRKMKLLADLGVKQAVLPPQDRPDVAALRRLGFSGSDGQVLSAAFKADPVLLAACSSASAMWAANAATVSPSSDTADHRVHITPANLVNHLHRSLEAPTTAAILKAVFKDERHFAHHPPLLATAQLSDEGAANHLRLSPAHGGRGLEVFVYGRSAFEQTSGGPVIYPARQAKEASVAIARLHELDDAATMLVEQNPAAVDQGVFHNDVVAVSNENVLLYHAAAFAERQAIDQMRRRFDRIGGGEMIALSAGADEVPLSDAVESYLFNSQLVTLPDGSMSLIAPVECHERSSSRRFIDRILTGNNPIRSVRYAEVRQSMQNGGGPACLRLRVVLNEAELQAIHQPVLLTDALYSRLNELVQHHYRDRLAADDLADPKLLEESRTALDALTQILQLGPIYPFQR